MVCVVYALQQLALQDACLIIVDFVEPLFFLSLHEFQIAEFFVGWETEVQWDSGDTESL